MILVAVGLLAIAVYISIAEAWIERDWPRDTIKLVGYALVVLIACLY